MRLGDVFTISSGGTPNKNEPAYYENGTIPWVKTGDLKSKYVSDEIEYITELGLKNSSAKLFPCGTVLIAMYGATIGACSILPYEASTNQACAAFLPNGTVLQEYLYYFLSSHKDKFVNDGVGGAQPNISAGYLKNVEFEIIPISEQQEIIDALEKVDTLISLRKQQLAKLDELVKARFVELFGDPVDNPKNYLVKSLQELIDMRYITYHLDGNHGGDYPRSEEFVDSGVPYLGANSIVNGEIDFSIAKFLTAERAGKLRKGIAQNDDVLFAHNATVGPTVVLKTTEPKVILSTSLTAYRCNKSNLLPNYLKAYMQSDGFVRQYSGEMKQTTRNQVPITAQKKYLFIVPPITEQEEFASFVEQTDKSKSVIQQSLEKLETLKKALMQKYFG